MGPLWLCALAALAALAVSGGQARRARSRSEKELFPLSVVHLNDFHARIEQIAPSGAACRRGEEATCVGGIARVVAKARELLSERRNALLLNAGGNIRGTAWTSVYGSKIIAEFLNRLPWDAFVQTPKYDLRVTASFLQTLVAPVVVANIDVSNEPFLNGLFNKSVVVERAGRKIGIIGIVAVDIKSTTSTRKMEVSPAASALAAEAQKLKGEGVDIIIVLSHLAIEDDLALAETDPDVDLIVGGHTHALLFNGAPPDGSPSSGDYPTIVTQPSGRKVAVVQAGCFSRYLGDLTAHFDAAGELVSAEGNLVYLDHSVQPDAETLAAVQPLARALAEAPVVGQSLVLLEAEKPLCSLGECSLGSFVADAFVHAFAGKGPQGTWTRAAIGLYSNGLRNPIGPGDVTVNDLMSALPFNNTVDLLEVRGAGLRRALEHAVASPKANLRAGPGTLTFAGFLQVSGLHVVYDTGLPAGERVSSVEVLCHACPVPKYEPLQDDEWYPVALVSYLVDGGDGFAVFLDEGRNLEKGPLDVVAVMEYLKVRKPVVQAREQRIRFMDSAEEKKRLCGTVEGAQ